MLGAIKYGLRNLLNFTGRDARQTFWYFVLAVYIVFTVLSMVTMVPLMMQIFAQAFAAAQSGASEVETDAAIMGQMGGMFNSIGWMGIVTGVGMMLLLAASFVRRLHDSDLSGWWAAIPGAIYAYSLSQMPAQMEAMSAVLADPGAGTPQNPFTMMQAQGSMAFLGWLPMLIVIVLGVRKSSPASNRYGTEPVSF
ncbi:MAG TPA: DUF805 domain-containing protein [Novosphingobium sp.]|nr:DUF805 domain-containing protein [Novosphingobium sp.]